MKRAAAGWTALDRRSGLRRGGVVARSNRISYCICSPTVGSRILLDLQVLE